MKRKGEERKIRKEGMRRKTRRGSREEGRNNRKKWERRENVGKDGWK